jgi:hypothetical protein
VDKKCFQGLCQTAWRDVRQNVIQRRSTEYFLVGREEEGSCETDASEKGPDKEIEFSSDIRLLEPIKVLPHPSLDAVHIK